MSFITSEFCCLEDDNTGTICFESNVNLSLVVFSVVGLDVVVVVFLAVVVVTGGVVGMVSVVVVVVIADSVVVLAVGLEVMSAIVVWLAVEVDFIALTLMSAREFAAVTSDGETPFKE